MTTREKLIAQLLNGKPGAITFSEFQKGLAALGYIHDRSSGSHEIWIHADRALSLNIQPKGKMAKPYQIQQFRHQWNG